MHKILFLKLFIFLVYKLKKIIYNKNYFYIENIMFYFKLINI